MAQDLAVAAIVLLAALYAAWRWAPARWRGGFARWLASAARRVGLGASHTARMERTLAGSAGCGSGCDSCGSCGSAGSAQQKDAAGAQPVRFLRR